MINYTEYLTEDAEINFKKLYSDLSKINGFRKKENRIKLYNNVISWYSNTIESNDDSPDEEDYLNNGA